MKATLELTPVILQACLLTKQLSAFNENTKVAKKIPCIRTLDTRDDGSVYCYGQTNNNRSSYIYIPASILVSLLEEGSAVLEYNNEQTGTYLCKWYLK